MSFSSWNRAAWLSAVLGLVPLALRAQETVTNLTFDDGRMACAIVAPQAEVPGLVLECLPVAMKSALETIGTPPAPARLTIRLQAPPPFYKRLKALFSAEASAVQNGDEIEVHAGDDPLKLSFRLGHELAHWLASRKYPVRLPLWLDEGLAQFVGTAAAETSARVHKQNLERPMPGKLADNLYRLDELVALRGYPGKPARAAAFYWQAEALVRALHKRLGAAEFATYLELLCVPNPPAWQAPLRERWYFSDWDMNWLAEQIRPATTAAPAQ